MTSEIWIAEDDRSLRWVMEKAIRREDIMVKSFESGEELLDALEQNQPEIIISDIRMPGNGWIGAFTAYPCRSSRYANYYYNCPL